MIDQPTRRCAAGPRLSGTGRSHLSTTCIVFGTGYDQDAGHERPVEFVEEIPRLTDEEKTLILSDNAYRIFELEPALAVAS